MRKPPEFRVGNVAVKPVHGDVLELTVTVDNVPAVAWLERGEAMMLAGALSTMSVHRFDALQTSGGEDSGQLALPR